ncbi:membrane-targeted effector domain-containing toxin [Pseudomonas sp. NPDC089996]|uniref:membrane-targeted effector domain-containing toxin n=1 Tax=Pseudomonas sp. NPDC089996 TaxID=3364474 RepID=UPI0037F7448C
MSQPTQQHPLKQQLEAMAAQLVSACPDMRQMARDVAQALLAKHGQAARDPDQVYLNRFDAAQSSPRTFSGWEHHSAPVQSFTLPQLVMHRFDVHDQDNADLLSYQTGFYTDGSDKTLFDEHNELPIAPRDVLEDFWAIDFSSQFNQRLTRFWSTHADDFRTLTKVNFLSKVVEFCANPGNPRDARRVSQVARALLGTTSWPPTLDQLRQQVVPGPGYRLCTFDIGGYVASDILRIELEDGGQFLYIPGEDEPLHVFANHKALYWWVLNNTNETDNRARFMGHFRLESHAERTSSVGLNHMLDLLFYKWGSDGHSGLNMLDTTLRIDPFTHLRKSTRQRMVTDAQFALRSNSDLRKQLWIGYLRAFGQIAGAMAAVDWPIALAAVGAGLADTGLNIDQAINGHTTAERQTGVTGAIVAAINTVFNAAALWAAPFGEVEPAQAVGPTEPVAIEQPVIAEDDTLATPAEISNWVPRALAPVEDAQLLAPFETNLLLQGSPGNGALDSIFIQSGKFYAVVNAMPYQVRWVAEMHTWVVVDPANPYSFYRNVPIRLLAGEWHILERPGLRGGRLPRRLLCLWGWRAPPPALEGLPGTGFEIPEASRGPLKSAALSGNNRALTGEYGNLNPEREQHFQIFRNQRNRLSSAASEFLATHVPPPRPQVPELARQASPKQIIRAVYERSRGLVIGEAHGHLGSKRFLIDNMPQLKNAQVKVLYMEHLMTDFQQADLDAFNSTGEMPAELRTYVERQDIGHFTDRAGRYTYLKVLKAARKEGIRIQALDCMASYLQAWEDLPPAQARQQMMNYYAHLVIDADQASRGACNWVALVGNTHSNTFEGVPGISELQGAIGLRVEDIHLGSVGSVGLDPGIAVLENGPAIRRVRGDLRLQVAIASNEERVPDLEQRLRNAGDFTFRLQADKVNLVHRSHDSTLIYTLVQEHGRYLQIDRPTWPWISGRHMANLAAIRSTLERWGFRYRPD